MFWVPKESRWSHLQSRAKLPSIGKDVDDAMVALERDNPRLKGSLNKSYGRAALDKHRLGELIDRVHRELTDDLHKIVTTYHAWRGDKAELNSQSKRPTYEDIAGFCKSASKAEIESHGYVLTPGRYVGAEEVEDDGETFEAKMPRLVAELGAPFAESAKLEKPIKANLKAVGYGGEKA